MGRIIAIGNFLCLVELKISIVLLLVQVDL